MMKKYVLSGTKSPFLISLFLLLLSICVSGQSTTTYTFNSKSWGASPSNWTSKKDGNGYNAVQGLQVTTGSNGACGNSPVSFSNVSQVKVIYSTNNTAGVGTIRINSVESESSSANSGTQIGSTFSITKPSSGGTTDKTATFTASSTLTGNIQIYITCSTNSIYIKSVEITYTTSCDTANVTTDPSNQSTTTAGTATFTVAGTGTVQWQENTGSGWNNLSNSGVYSGVTSNNLVITNPAIGMDGYQYRAILSQSCDSSSATSNPATLSVTQYVGPCFSEDFSSITNGDSTTTGGSSTSWAGNSNFPTVENAYQAGGTVKIGKSGEAGSITSRSLTEVEGNITVQFDVKGWTNVEGDIVVTMNGTSQTVTYSAKMSDSFETKSINFSNVPTGSTLKIETTAKRAFIDNIQIFCAPTTPQTPEITSSLTHSSEYGAATTYTITANYLPTSFNANGLPTGLSVNASTGEISGTVTANAGDYNITISATNDEGTDTKTLVWTVTKKIITITGFSFSKVYDGNTTAANSGTPALQGVLSDDATNVTLNGTPAFTYNDKNVGNNKPITIIGNYTLSGIKSGNYTLTQPTGLQGNITAKNLTVTGAVAQNKTYDGTTTATITGANLQGVISPDVVTVSGGGTFASPNAGTGISVTANLTLGGSDAGNYTLTQPTGLSADITKANPVFTTSTINLTVSGTYTLPGANISSTSNGGYTYSITGDGHATYDGVTTLTGVSVGTETLTINQAATPNFNAGSTTVTVNVSSYNMGDYMSKNDGNWHGTAANGTTNTWQQYNGSAWVDISNSPPSNSTSLGTKKVYIKDSITIVGTNTAPNVIILGTGKLNTSTTSATFGNLLIKSGGKFYRKSTGSGVSGTFEIENGGSAYIELNHSTASAASSSIFAGTEIFHKDSNVIITRTYNGSNYIPDFSNISLFDGAYFGNLIIDQSSGNSICLLPADYNGVLTNGNLILRASENNIRFSNSSYTATIRGNLILEPTFINSLNIYAGSSGTANLIVNGSIEHEGTSNLNLNTTSGGTSIVNLKGNLTVGSTSKLISTVSNNSLLNFIGNGAVQTIDVANASTASNIAFNVNYGAYVQLINQNLALGASSSFTVKNGGIFDFGFSGSNALNITNHVNSANFTTESGSTIKITSPDGITTSTGSGNVQTMTTGRTYNPAGIYHYIGKENQVTGNGLPGGIASDGTEIKVIADLDDSNPVSPYDDRLTLTVNGMINLNTTGELEIRRGTVIDAPNNGFSDATSQNAKLTMSNGRYKIFRTAGSTQPALGGTYTLTGGVIEFAGNGTFNIRTDKDYLNVEVTGSDVTAGTTENSGLSFLENGTFKVMNEGVFKVNNPNGFSGDSTTAVKNTNNPSITLEDGSTVEYTRADDQLISVQNNVGQGEGNYYNLKISGSGTKTATTGTTTINGMTSLISTDAVLLVPATNEDENPNVFKALGGIENKLDENTTGTFRLGNNAQLIQHTDTRDNADNSKAKIEAQRLVTSIHNTTGTGGQMDYIYWSTPVGNQKLQSFSPNTPSNRFYEYIESTDLFKSINAQDNFISGKGYAIRAENGITQGNDKTYTFAGTPNNGDITFVDGIKKSSSTTGGYNLVGNPYPSNIDADAMFAENPEIYTTAFFWTNKNYNFPTQQGSTYDGSNYAVYNNVGGNPATYDATMDDDTPTNIIKVGQGFIVQKIEEGTSDFVFHNNMRITEKGNFYEKNTNPKNRFWITLTSPANLVNTMLIGYIQGATNDYEKNYDAESLSVGSDAVYSVLEDKKLAIQGRNYLFDKEDKIPMGTNQYQSGIYTIALKNPEGIFASDQKIYLHDKLNDSYTNLSESNYQFDAEAGSTENRFEIVYQPNDATLATDLSSKENLWVYRNGENFVVKSTVNINEIEVYDVSGRLQQKIKGNTKEIVISGSALVSGMYVLKIKRGNDLSSEKIIK